MVNEKNIYKEDTKTVPHLPGTQSRKDFLREVMKMPGGEKILECIQCGTCAGGCPTGFAMEYSPMQIIKMINLGMKRTVLSSSAIWACSACYTCTTRCPRNVNFATLAMSLKNQAISENMVENSVNSNFHKYFTEVVSKYGRIHEIELLSKLVDFTDFDSVKHNAALGVRLFRKGKVRIRAPKTEQNKWFGEMLEKIREKKSQ